MELQQFGERVSARRCWVCCSDDLTESTWVLVGRRLVCAACVRGREVPRTIVHYRGRADAPRTHLRAAYAAVVKYKELCTDNGSILASVLASAVMTVAAVHGLPSSTILVPVPSYGDARPHMRTLCTLAQPLLSGIQLSPILRKVRDFRQAHLNAAARRAASAEAYKVHGRVKNRTIIVADDIMTTGATLAACANALYEKGAALVCGAAIVRAMRRPRTGLTTLGSRQVTVRWTELDDRQRTGIAPGRAAIWVRFGCGTRCPFVLTAGPFRAPAVGTESLHAWKCECGEQHAVALRREWQGEASETIRPEVGEREPSELLIGQRHYRG